jgi:hypothetical protein
MFSGLIPIFPNKGIDIHTLKMWKYINIEENESYKSLYLYTIVIDKDYITYII